MTRIKSNKFIAVKLTNGFGNNIFQYVAGRLLAEYHQYYFFAIPPSKEYYAIDSLIALGVNFDSTIIVEDYQIIDDQNYLQAYDSEFASTNLILQGYFENYKYYLPKIELIKSWFPKVKTRTDNNLVIHFRGGDRLCYANEFYSKPNVQKYLNAITQFNFEKLHIVTDMPKWDYYSVEEFENSSFHVSLNNHEIVSTKESVEFFNAFVEGFSSYKPVVHHGELIDDFNLIRGSNNILFEHGTLSWWAAFLSNANKVGVYGPWRAFKGENNKNLSHVPLNNWFKWD